MPVKQQESKLKVFKILEFVKDNKAYRPVILDVREISGICDYFVVCSGDTGKHVEGICQGVIEKAKRDNIKVHHHENDKLYKWVLVDFIDVILHVFEQEARGFYDLEYLWRNAKKVRR